MNDAERAARGRRAADELAETEAAFASVEAAILAELTRTSITQPEKVLKLHAAIQNLAAVKQALVSVVTDGQLAEHAIAIAGLTRPN